MNTHEIHRRTFLHQANGFGALAAASMLFSEDQAEAAPVNVGEGGKLRALHHPPKAKRVVQLFMGGAASHLDLWDTSLLWRSITARNLISENTSKRSRTVWGLG